MTKIITIKYGRALEELSEYTERSTENLQESIINHLINLKYLYDCTEDCGQLLTFFLNECDYEIGDFCRNVFKIYNNKVDKLVKELYVWGLDYDCKDCGLELEDGICSNCGFDNNIYPDPDQYRDDCKIEYTFSKN